MNSCLLPPKIVTDVQTDNSTFHPPPHIAIVQLFQLNKMAQLHRQCHVLLYQQHKDVPLYSYLYCDEPVRWWAVGKPER